MDTVGAVPCPGGERTAAPLVASANLVQSLTTLDPALAALALAEEIKRSFFHDGLGRSSCNDNYLSLTASAFASFATKRVLILLLVSLPTCILLLSPELDLELSEPSFITN
jgi:hypothetical protein